MITQRPAPSTEGRRIVICDYNALLLSVSGLLRMSDYAVFQAHDGYAAQELCTLLPDIELLILNTYGTGIDVGELCQNVRTHKHGLPILHIGSTIPYGLPEDVPTLAEDFTSESLLRTVRTLVDPSSTRNDPPLDYRNGRRREDSGSHQAALPSVDPVTLSVPPLRILVVEDERVLCELVARMLREAGYIVVTACDGEGGWELVSRGADFFDLVITDSRLPGISGRELVERLRKHNPTLPIIHLTGSLSGGMGFPDNVPTLLKPFDLSKLVPMVQGLLAA